MDIDVLVIGAGAAGMMCAIEAAKRGRRVLVIDHAARPGEKIRISGGGRCNFTNVNAAPKNYLSRNPSFCISALRRYGWRNIVRLVDDAGIAWHEKTLGQLFCDGSATQIIDMLTGQLRQHGARLMLGVAASDIRRAGDGFTVRLSPAAGKHGRNAAHDGAATGPVEATCAALVIATGGKSIPKMGATGFAFEVAAQFGLKVIEPRPGLVPFTLAPEQLAALAPLAGVAVDAVVSHTAAGGRKTSFAEALLFTHRGLSGPAILQISSYWREGDAITLSLAPGVDVFAALKTARAANGRQAPQTALAAILPKRLAQAIVEMTPGPERLADCNDKHLRALDAAVNAWVIRPNGTEGYRTAEVMLGGVDTEELDQKTMAVKSTPGLYVIGEAVDVTGWLGGYNFQWAWASGWCAGQAA
ncbi:NAD(P)/FAD-dependent oxidoreductase [Camelimonas sp. ID_303_24]